MVATGVMAQLPQFSHLGPNLPIALPLAVRLHYREQILNMLLVGILTTRPNHIPVAEVVTSHTKVLTTQVPLELCF